MSPERRRSDTVHDYDLESLRAGVLQRDKNIALFREAIEKELAYKVQLLQLIKELEKGQ